MGRFSRVLSAAFILVGLGCAESAFADNMQLQDVKDGAMAPRDHSWYMLAADKKGLFVVDENSASAADGVVSFVESQVFYTKTSVGPIGIPARRVDSFHMIDCKTNSWKLMGLGLIDDNNQVMTNVSFADQPQWMPISADSVEENAANHFCLGQYNKKMIHKDKDIFKVQQAYLEAARDLQ